MTVAEDDFDNDLTSDDRLSVPSPPRPSTNRTHVGARGRKPGFRTQRGDETRERIIDFVVDYHAKNGVSPTLMEIASGVGLASHNAVRAHLLILQREGRISQSPGKYRTVQVTDSKG